MNHEVYLRFGRANLGGRFNEAEFEVFGSFLGQISIKNWHFYDDFKKKRGLSATLIMRVLKWRVVNYAIFGKK